MLKIYSSKISRPKCPQNYISNNLKNWGEGQKIMAIAPARGVQESPEMSQTEAETNLHVGFGC